MRALLICNPAATTTTAATIDAVARALSAALRVDVAATARRGHAARLAADAVAGGCDVVAVLGGDGTVNEALPGVAGTAARLAVIPGGSANVFARALGLPRDPRAATAAVVRALRRGQDRTVALGLANDRLFACSAGWGYDAEVVRMVERHPRTKRTFRQAAFLWYGVLAQRAGRAATASVTVSAAGEAPVGPLRAVVCCNADPYTYLGPLPARMCPAADLAAGLDVTALSRARLVDVARVVRAALTGAGVPRLPHVRTWHDRGSYALSSATPLPLQVDGEFAGHADRLSLRRVPGALTVVA